MKRYRLDFVLEAPSEETEDRILAEIPDVPACRAWGDRAAQALEDLPSVATASSASAAGNRPSIAECQSVGNAGRRSADDGPGTWPS